MAAKNNHTDTVWYILKNISQGVNIKNDHGQRPIHLAARSGHHQVVVLLLKTGSDLNDK